MKNVVLWNVLLLLTSCYASTDPYSFNYVEVQDKSQVLVAPEVKDGAATLIVRREPGYMGSYALTRFIIDGQPVVRLLRGEQHTFQIPSGQHVAGSSFGDGIQKRANDVLFNAMPGQAYIFRIHGTQTEWCLISPMTQRVNR